MKVDKKCLENLDEAKKLNQEIFETIYFAALTASMEEAHV
jgi:ribonucleoside-diphosphate reductase alpha chain